MPPKAKKSKRIEERTTQNLILDQTSVQSLVQSISGLKKQVGDLQSRMDSQEQSNMASQLTSVDQPGQNEQQSSTGQPIIPVDVPTDRTEPMNYTCTIQNQGMASISRLYMHHAIPLGATVPDNVRRLIWDDEFVELSTLLPETMDKALHPKNAVIENLANPVLTAKDHNTTISSLDLWQTAFSVFISIYVENNPEAAKGLIKYMEVVREIARKKGNW